MLGGADRDFTREAHLGLDLTWYGVDLDGCVAEFTSGYAAIPTRVFEDEGRYRDALSYFEGLPASCLATLTKTIQKRRKRNRGGDYSLYLNEAKKGLYSYGENHHSPSIDYDLVAIPSTPLPANSLPAHVTKTLIPLKLVFRSAETVTLRSRPV